MKTISVINQKGGSSKSSSCFHLAGLFASQGLKVLVIDVDPQGSLSRGFFGSANVENLVAAKTVTALFDKDQFFSDIQSLPLPTDFTRISVLPANQTLADHNQTRPAEAGSQQFNLRTFVQRLAGFDLVLIDCPPNLYQCTWNALLASDRVLIPVPPEDFGAQGLRATHAAIEQAQRLNLKLRLLGHLVTRHDRRLLIHRSYERMIRERYGESVLTTVIPEVSAFKVALACRTPVTLHDPSSNAARLTQELGCEILRRMDDVM